MKVRAKQRGSAAASRDPSQRLRAMVSRCFPTDARVIAIPRQADTVFAISWRLSTDQSWPTKRSKTIRLAISSEILDHYLAISDYKKKKAELLIETAIQEQLATFDPDHQQQQGEDPPVVEWCVGGSE